MASELHLTPEETDSTDNVLEKIGFYHEYEEYGCFSNWYPAEFDYAGRHYANSEQYMMYHKVMMFGRKECRALKRDTIERIRRFTEDKSLLWIDRNYKEQGIKLGSILEKGVIPKLIEMGLM